MSGCETVNYKASFMMKYGYLPFPASNRNSCNNNSKTLCMFLTIFTSCRYYKYKIINKYINSLF